MEVGSGLRITTALDGQRTLQRRCFGSTATVCIATTVYPATSNSGASAAGALSSDVYIADLKGNIAHTFQTDGSPKAPLFYDEFGLYTLSTANQFWNFVRVVTATPTQAFFILVADVMIH